MPDGESSSDHAFFLSLHLAVLRVSRILHTAHNDGFPEDARVELSRRFAEHGLLVEFDHGCLTVPMPQVFSSSMAPDWLSRTLLLNAALDASMDCDLRDLTGHRQSAQDEPATWWLTEAQAWQLNIAEPLHRLDQVWHDACQAVLHRRPLAEPLARLDMLLPGDSAPSWSATASGAGAFGTELSEPAALTVLMERISSGSVAWSQPGFANWDAAVAALDQLTATPATVPEVLRQHWDRTVSVAADVWAELRELMVLLAGWARNTVAPILVELYWDALARALLTLLPPAPPLPWNRRRARTGVDAPAVAMPATGARPLSADEQAAMPTTAATAPAAAAKPATPTVAGAATEHLPPAQVEIPFPEPDTQPVGQPVLDFTTTAPDPEPTPVGVLPLTPPPAPIPPKPHLPPGRVTIPHTNVQQPVNGPGQTTIPLAPGNQPRRAAAMATLDGSSPTVDDRHWLPEIQPLSTPAGGHALRRPDMLTVARAGLMPASRITASRRAA